MLPSPQARTGELSDPLPASYQGSNGHSLMVRTGSVLVCQIEGCRERKAQAQAYASARRGSEQQALNLQGHEDVEKRRSDRRGAEPLARPAPSDRWQGGSQGCQPAVYRLQVRSGLFLASGSWRWQIRIVGISEWSRGQKGIKSPEFIELGCEQEKNQEISDPFNLQNRRLA